MHYVNLGDTGIKISKLGFGTMTFGSEADEKTSLNLYQKCREYGINLFDCANVYNKGRAEIILGKCIASERDEVIITSKVYCSTSEKINAGGLSRRHIIESVEKSLKRLNTNYIDIYFMHFFDVNTSLYETLSAMTDLVKQGKILYLGASNFAAWQVMKALGISTKEFFTKIVCIQPMYNILRRQAEVEIFPMALSEKIGVITYNPLAGGLLSGKYTLDTVQGRLKENKMYQLRYVNTVDSKIANSFIDFAKKLNLNPVALAIAWSATNPAVTAPLLGARSVEQLTECFETIKITLNEDLRSEISALSTDPPLATDRNEEK